MLTQTYAEFGFEMLRELYSKAPNDNVFLSPTSIAVALAMTANGSTGMTREAILRVIHSDKQSIENVNADNHVLVERIMNTKTVQLSMANAVWFEPGIPLNPIFTQILKKAYCGMAGCLDFRNLAAPQIINAWIAEHTDDRIQKIVDQVDPTTVAMLTNATAFKGRWTLPFDPGKTETRDFRITDDRTCQVSMMTNTAEYAYSNKHGAESIRLTYADGSFALYIVLPPEAIGVQSFLEQLTADAFAELTRSLVRQKGRIELPRFSIGYNSMLNQTLTKLGMGLALSSSATFEAIHVGPPPIQLSAIHHAAFLMIDEEGTEAAAATSLGFRARAITVERPPFHMFVDRPFVLAICDERTGQLLFTGAILEPKS